MVENKGLLRIVTFAWLITIGLLFYFEFHRMLPNSSSPVLHGASDQYKGSCYCGADTYCLCTPSLAIDAIIEMPNISNEVSILLVFRRDPPADRYAIPGGFVNVGESIEAATIREVKEETNLDLHSLEQFRVYSDPLRDKRRHTASAVLRCIARVEDAQPLRSGDDAKSLRVVKLREAPALPLAFDHRQILLEYMRTYHPGLLPATG